MTCHTCGGDVGEHFGQCPEGAESLPMTLNAYGRLTAALNVPRESLRLVLVDAEPIQPNLFTEEITI